MKANTLKRITGVLCGAAALTSSITPAEVKWTAAEKDGRLEARWGDQLRLVWQIAPLSSPKGGAKFAGSAFLHSLRTPAGFEWTTIQPGDHLHHFGLWWPWKYLDVEGKHYNCWEIQQGEGGMVAKSVKRLAGSPDKLEWEFLNEMELRAPGASPRTVIRETAQVALSNYGKDATLIDLTLRQNAVGTPVTVVNYRYSGFAWRGPASWNKDTSLMTTSEGKGRDDANGKPARWVVVSGPAPKGSASVLLMSDAIRLAGTPESLRVWDSKTNNGNLFVNFNPVSEKPLPLDEQHPAVSHRKYRVIAADHVIAAPEAEAEWRKWTGK